MSEYTPGPWAVHPHLPWIVPADHVSRPLGGATDDDVDLATYAQDICALDEQPRHRTRVEAMANARLIAAAPEMLEVLAEYLMLGAGKCTIGRQQADRALAVVRKATEGCS